MRRFREAVCVLLSVMILLFAVGGAAAAAAPETDENSGEEQTSAILEGGITVAEDSGIRIVELEDGGYEICGLVAGPAAEAVRAATMLSMFVLPDGITGMVTRGEFTLEPEEIVATGDRVEFAVAEFNIAQATVIVTGDVIGSGIMSLAQLVRMAAVMNGTAPPLEGPYLAAGDFDGNGAIGLGDMVRESQLLQEAIKES